MKKEKEGDEEIFPFVEVSGLGPFEAAAQVNEGPRFLLIIGGLLLLMGLL